MKPIILKKLDPVHKLLSGCVFSEKYENANMPQEKMQVYEDYSSPEANGM